MLPPQGACHSRCNNLCRAAPLKHRWMLALVSPVGMCRRAPGCMPFRRNSTMARRTNLGLMALQVAPPSLHQVRHALLETARPGSGTTCSRRLRLHCAHSPGGPRGPAHASTAAPSRLTTQMTFTPTMWHLRTPPSCGTNRRRTSPQTVSADTSRCAATCGPGPVESDTYTSMTKATQSASSLRKSTAA